MKKHQNILGISVNTRSIEVCQVERNGSTFNISNCASYQLSEGVTPDNIAADSTQFRTFLKANGFKSRKAVVGIPARHILSTSLNIPMIKDTQLLHETVKIQLERKVEVDIGELVFDYDESQRTTSGNILVLMALKKIINQVKQLLAEARLSAVQVINTSLAIGPSTASDAAFNIIEYPDCFELCLYNHGYLNSIRHLSKSDPSPLNRQHAEKILRQANRMCFSESIEGAVRYSLWTDCDLPDQDKAQITGVFENIEFAKTAESSGNPGQHLAALLAQSVLSEQITCINFMNGRHIEAKPTFIKRQFRKIAAVAVILFILIAAFIWDWQSDKQQIAYLKNKMDSIKDNVKTSEEMINQVIYARQWFDQTPRYLEILRELSLSFEEYTDVWLTSLGVDESSNQILTGRTANENSILDVVAKMRSRKYFEDIKVLYIRKMGKGTNIMTFAINLRCRKEQ